MLFAFRADGSSTIGLGHVMRCLCLAEALKHDGFKSFFITKDYGETVLSLIRLKGFDVEILPEKISLQDDLDLTLKALTARKADSVIVDSYDVNEAYLNEIKQSGLFLISIDDKATLKFPSNLIINPNLGVSASDYHGVEKSKILLGPSYALLRSEFRESRKKRSFDITPKKVLISFGGSNTSELVERMVKLLLSIPDLHITAVVGQGGPDSFQGIDSSRVEIKKNARNMAELMAEADFGILSAGTTAWETACLGLPALMVQIADNQQKNAEQLDSLGIALNAGPAKSLNDLNILDTLKKLLGNRFKREQMSAAGQKLVDGNGTSRIVSEIKKRTVYEKN